MAKWANYDSEKFGLVIHKIATEEGVDFAVNSQSDGIPEAEIILVVDAWLQKAKENFQNPIRDGLGGEPDET